MTKNDEKMKINENTPAKIKNTIEKNAKLQKQKMAVTRQRRRKFFYGNQKMFY